jgi:hypothetical protein
MAKPLVNEFRMPTAQAAKPNWWWQNTTRDHLFSFTAADG